MREILAHQANPTPPEQSSNAQQIFTPYGYILNLYIGIKYLNLKRGKVNTNAILNPPNRKVATHKQLISTRGNKILS